jgi:hypothetical protein
MTLIIIIGLLIAIAITVGMVSLLKNSIDKKSLSFYDPTTAYEQMTVEAAIFNLEKIIKAIRRNTGIEGTIEIDASQIVKNYKGRCPFRVHDLLHATAKYLSTILKYKIKIVYRPSYDCKQTAFPIRHIKSGIEETRDLEILALCIYWFIWHYDKDPYKLDQGFSNIPISTNLLLGRFFGYQDKKGYDSDKDHPWEDYTPYYEYNQGKTNELKVNVSRTTSRTIIFGIPEPITENAFPKPPTKTMAYASNVNLKLQGNVFYDALQKILGNLCFSTDRDSTRNLIAPAIDGEHWGENYDTWLFLCSMFLAKQMLSRRFSEETIKKDQLQFLASCRNLYQKLYYLNLDKKMCSLLDVKTLSDFNKVCTYDILFFKLEPHLEAVYREIFLDAERLNPSNDAQITAFVFFNYLLFGSYKTISYFNRSMANTAIYFTLEQINKVKVPEEEYKEDYAKFPDPTLN